MVEQLNLFEPREEKISLFEAAEFLGKDPRDTFYFPELYDFCNRCLGLHEGDLVTLGYNSFEATYVLKDKTLQRVRAFGEP